MSNFGRRTWDREEYARLAREGNDNSEEEKLRLSLTDEQLEQLKSMYSDHDSLLKSGLDDLNKKVLATGVTSYKKGKQFGFYCKLCNMTFKDNLQYIDHLNHKIHQIKFEAIFDEPLILDIRDNDEIGIEEFATTYKRLIKGFIKDNGISKQKVNKKSKPIKKVKLGNSSEDAELHKKMGFSSFGGGV
ncbi:hypothetical protein Kpol_1032p79 [Vanderwaltozyma polyspora DSM 70294]|uniref:C2H2-type domain-containing protein n=1 Tax=Vanderwaltozyma polyspora (strain ATCC 22028 / DSM 70294 / BCRC 21397 / CBS 2163 / NBRC 10782 / NRRL Y-8283 / UCD 57-17) TaxID=436907 RepID=A7TH30_VANPO|nr:uncharacterized protein Kpol_1032p79 [Vanderwaltozyma polyspora DSM 70294]EDO18482.1 hypothetical protein Kpol_1032p79 [Vanderwaltozyma polyspora DSM 70294]